MENSNLVMSKISFKAAISDFFKTIDLNQSTSVTMFHLIEFLGTYFTASKVNLFEYFTENESILLSSTDSKEFQYEQEVPLNLLNNKICINIRNEEIVYQILVNDNYYIELFFKEDPKIHFDILYEVSYESAFFMKITKRLTKHKEDGKRYRLLFKLTNKFFNTLLLDELLEELVSTISMLFIEDELTIWLTHENYTSKPLPIKVLDYQTDDVQNEAIESYISGEVQISKHDPSQKINLYAPLKGKQGVYGVLQVSSTSRRSFTKEESSFISIIGNTAGSAIENAQMFSQYKNFVNDLQFINETGQALNACKKMTETINFSTKKIMETFGAQEVGYYLKKNGIELTMLEGSTSYFQEKELSLFLQVLIERVEASHEAIYIGDFHSSYPNIPSPFQSILAFPLLQANELKGVSFVLHENNYHFQFEVFKLLESFASQTTLSLMNTTLREELEEMVITDYLTRLYSRKHLDKVLAKSLRTDQSGVFILLDIDNFKNTNDIYGHQAGDQVLIQVAEILKRNIRGRDIAARWGGEELALYLPNATLEVGEKVGARILALIPNETDPKTTVSIGISYWEENNEYSGKELFQLADEALYEAKQSGKNCYKINRTELVL